MPRLAPVIKTVFCAMFIQPPCSPLSPESAPIPASILMTFDGGALSTGRRCELSAALEQETTDGVILRQADRPLEGVGRLGLPSQATKEMAAHSPVGLVGGDRDATTPLRFAPSWSGTSAHMLTAARNSFALILAAVGTSAACKTQWSGPTTSMTPTRS